MNRIYQPNRHPAQYSQDEAHNIINTMYVYVQEIKFTKDFERCSYIYFYVRDRIIRCKASGTSEQEQGRVCLIYTHCWNHIMIEVKR